MSSNFGTWAGVLGAIPITTPYIASIPRQLQQGDSAAWIDQPFVDKNGTGYDSNGYTLKYVLAGPIAATIMLTAVANASGWQTSLDLATSLSLKAGTYFWQAQVFATGVRFTLDDGELTVSPDLALVGANYDGRTQAEIALNQALTAYSTFSQSSGRVKAYTIGHRSMTFDTLAEIKQQIDFWRVRVTTERSIKNGARDRHVQLRFDRTR